MKMKISALAGLLLLAACGSSKSSGSSGNSGNSGTPVSSPTCFDGAGKPTSTCAVTPTGNVCSMGDSNSCTPLTKLEVYADDGKNGICLHLVFQNNCANEIFADTCIEHQDQGGASGTSWQCWTSSVEPGFPLDVSQCAATGNYFYVSSTSPGQLDIDENKCPAPSP